MTGHPEAPRVLETWRDCLGSPDQAQINWLLDRGIPPSALALDQGFNGFTISIAAVVFDGDRFDLGDDRPGEESQTALVFVARDQWGEPVDLVAWAPRFDLVATYLGAIGLLGEQAVLEPRLGEPLRVHPNILNWLRAGRRGVVILNHARARRLLDGCGPLQAHTVEHGLDLRKILTAPTPEIRVPVSPDSSKKVAA